MNFKRKFYHVTIDLHAVWKLLPHNIYSVQFKENLFGIIILFMLDLSNILPQ